MSVLERIPNECPKCGGEVVLVDAELPAGELFAVGTRTYTVICPTCMFGSSSSCFTREDAFKSWIDTKCLYEAERELRQNRG